MGKGCGGRKPKPNDICPFCDSKRKYKKCCGSAEKLARAAELSLNHPSGLNDGIAYDEFSSDPARLGEIRRMIETGDRILDRAGRAELMARAGKNGNIELVKLLLAAKVDVNGASRTYTPLGLAAIDGRDAMVQFLIDAKANVNQVCTPSACSPLKGACQDGHAGVAKILLDANADVNLASKDDGGFPLFMAGLKGDVDTVKVLLDAKPDLHQVTKDGYTALYASCMSGKEEPPKILLAAKSNVDQPDKTGTTPLMITIQHGNERVAKMLLNANASVNAIDSLGQSPLDYAANNGHASIVKLLLKHGAVDTVATTADGQPVTRIEHWTSVKDNPEMMALFGRRRCGGCGDLKGKGETKPCPCKEVYYCSRVCQKKDWKAGHKKVCKSVQTAT